MKPLRIKWLPSFVIALAGIVGLLGCDTNSPDTAYRDTQIRVQGVYTRSGGRLVDRNTGAAVTSMNVIQTGNDLQAIDNNGVVFRGRIGSDNESSATFSLAGQTTAGQKVTITGNFTVSGNTGTMDGTWIEPSLTSRIYGSATVPDQPDNTTVRVSPTSATLSSNGQSRTFTASGGNGTFSWSVSPAGAGAVSPSAGSSVTYVRAAAGTATLTVTSDGASASATITQP